MRSLALIIGSSVLVLDLFTKWWVKSTLWLHYYPVIDGFFTVQLVRNEGIAFGLLHSLQSDWKPVTLSAIAVVAVSVVCYYIYHTPLEHHLSFVSLGLLLGGILGNFVDRLMHQYVVDFLTVHWKDQFAWPTFNLADAAITTGVFLLFLQTLFDRSGSKAIATLLLVPGLVLSVNAADPDQIIDQLQRKYEEVQSFTARFDQTFLSRGIRLQESGLVMMKKPGLMYWEYQEPTEKYFVAKGGKTYFYVPKDRQMIVSNLSLDESDSPLLFLLGRGDIRRDFLVAFEDGGGEEPGMDFVKLRLTPRQPQPEFSYLILELSPVTFLISRLVVVEPIGQQNEYELTDIRQNVRIPDRQFELKIPSYVEVIEE